MIPGIGKTGRGAPCEKLHFGIAWWHEVHAPIGTLERLQDGIGNGSNEITPTSLRDRYYSPARIDVALKFCFTIIDLVLESGISKSSLERSHPSLDLGRGKD
jgi:hypothetical protein